MHKYPPGCSHTSVVTDGRRHPNDLLQFRWIKILMGNLKNSLSGKFNASNYSFAVPWLRQNRLLKMAAMTERIANAICMHKSCLDRSIRFAELYT
jgi:hypothetical protein